MPTSETASSWDCSSGRPVVTFASGLLFDVDSSSLRPKSKKNLDNLASSLSNFGDSKLLLVGHTDSQGTDDYNQTLSSKRATSAENYLVSQGVSRARLRSTGRGEAEPIAPNDSDTGRQKNRRVEIAIYAGETLKAQALKSGL